MKLLEVCVETDGEAAEAVTALLQQYGQGGVVIEEDHDAPRPTPRVRVKVYLLPEQEPELRKIEQGIWHLGQIYPINEPTSRWLEEQDWTEVWKQHYTVQHIGKRTVIKPSWLDYTPAVEEIVIELDPGMAFGTGLHPSTRLCLGALEDHLQPGAKMLDVGTGSGILSIAAVKMGAGPVVAIEIDELALQVSRENMERNGVAHRIDLRHASLAPIADAPWERETPILNATGEWTGAFDLLVMNILAHVIAASAMQIRECLAPGSKFIVAGIIESQAHLVVEAFQEAGLEITERRMEHDWVSFIGIKGEQ